MRDRDIDTRDGDLIGRDVDIRHAQERHAGSLIAGAVREPDQIVERGTQISVILPHTIINGRRRLVFRPV